MTDRTDRLCCTVEDIKVLRGHMQGVTDADCEVLALAMNSLASAALPVFFAFASLADVLRNTLAAIAALSPEQRAQLEAWLEGGTPVMDLIHVGVTLEVMHAEDCDSYNGTGGKVCTCGLTPGKPRAQSLSQDQATTWLEDSDRDTAKPGDTGSYGKVEVCPGCAGIVERHPDGRVTVHHYSDPCDGKEHCYRTNTNQHGGWCEGDNGTCNCTCEMCTAPDYSARVEVGPGDEGAPSTCSCGAPLYHGGRICRDCAEQECP